MTYDAALSARDDLRPFGRNGLLLFALDLRFQVGDITTVAASSLTDGPDDKKCDLVYVDRAQGRAVIAQGYVSDDSTRREAPANKASDLNTAVSWLLGVPIEDVPETIRSPARELRDAIADGEIREIHAWYVHNLPESQNVANEIMAVEHALQTTIREKLSTSGITSFVGREVGRETLEEWYQALTTPILVGDDLTVQVTGAFETKGGDWSALVTAVPASWLYALYQQHGADLFSANVRGYLGSRRSDANINNGIKKTADESPENFWVYNNGLTGLVHGFALTPGQHGLFELRLTGLSIVNGAQTTGAIGSLDDPPGGEAMVPARFVKCNNQETVDGIIRYNNSQNKVLAADFRSNDPVQNRLRDEFVTIPNVRYLGGRRGGADDIIRRRSDLLPSDTAAQSLAAFHGDPVVAYNQKAKIWDSDSLYARFFSERTHASHIVFAFSLLRAVEAKKWSLIESQEAGTLTEAQGQQLAFFRLRGSTFLMTSAIAKAIEVYAGRALPDKFKVSFGSSVSPDDAEEAWRPIVEAATAFTTALKPALDRGFKNTDLVNQVVASFSALVDATKTVNEPLYRAFAARLVVDT